MKGFATNNGDVVVTNTIEIVDGVELLRQKAKLVIETKKGEWEFDINEGVDHSVFLTKNPDEGEIRLTIEEALKTVDETLVITSFDMTVTGRKAVINFTAINEEQEEIGGEYTYGA